MQPIIDKDFIELSRQELIQLVKDAKTHYYYYKKEGVNVAYGRENNNSNGVFDLEMVACKILTEYGHEVYLLPENYAADVNKSKKIHGDTITDDRTLELKHTAKNVQDNYRKAKHQATDVFIHIQNDISEKNALRQINSSIKAISKNNIAQIDFAGKVYLYFEKKDTLLLFLYDSNGKYEQISPKK